MALSVKDLTLGGQYSTGGRFLGTLLHLAMSYREATLTFELDGQCTEQRYALSTLFTHVPPAERVDPFEPGAPARLEYTERGSERGSDIVTFAIYPSARAARTPLDLCLALDNSGSMATGVTAAGRENLGHTSLDMVKHGARTLISGLLPDARLGVVSFSTEAKQVFYLAPMTPSNQATACAAVNGIVTENCTNIFGGLAQCLAMLPAPSVGRQQAVVLLTDGVNNEGPADVLAALKAWEKAQGRRAPPIYTMGFGNATESPRLVALSAHTDAQFGYMCDAGMVGTTFVNTMANLLTLQGADATITVESLAARSVAPPPKTILVGRFLVDQPKWVTVSVPSGPYRYVLRYTHIGRPGVTEVVGVSAAPADPVALSVERFRQDILATLEEAQGKAQYDRAGALALIQGLAQRLGECPYKREARHQGFFSDVVGQITEAIERKYGTWEGHYLQTLHQAYRNQVCTNFKDAGLQGFTSPYRTGIIEALDTVFNGLPPQPPTGEVPRSAAPLQSMAAYNNSDDPCFAGWSLVRLLDGSVKRVDAIVKGDRMANGGTILAVVRTYTGGTAALVRLRRRGDTNVGLWITPYHPVGDKSPPAPPGGDKSPPAPPFVGVKSPMGVETRSQKRRRLSQKVGVRKSSIPTANPPQGGAGGDLSPPQWCFPCDLGAVREQACPELYSFVMDRGHTMQIGGFECITLGHGCQADKARHPYLGTGRVIGDLAAQPGYATGLVKLLSGAFTRNHVTGLLDGLDPERVLPEDLPELIPCAAFELRAGLRV